MKNIYRICAPSRLKGSDSYRIGTRCRTIIAAGGPFLSGDSKQFIRAGTARQAFQGVPP